MICSALLWLWVVVSFMPLYFYMATCAPGEIATVGLSSLRRDKPKLKATEAKAVNVIFTQMKVIPAMCATNAMARSWSVSIWLVNYPGE